MPIANGSMQGQPWGHEADMLIASPNVRFQRQQTSPSQGRLEFLGTRPGLLVVAIRLRCYRRDAATWSDWLRQPASWLLLLRIRLRFEYGAAIVGELRRVLPQTRHDAVYIRNLIIAQSHTSGVQAICCSQVPRYSWANATFCKAPTLPIARARLSTIRCAAMSDPFI